MTVYRVVFEGPAALAVRVATELADADGVDLVSAEPPSVVGADTVELSVSVEGGLAEVAGAVARIRDGLPMGASVEIDDD